MPVRYRYLVTLLVAIGMIFAQMMVNGCVASLRMWWRRRQIRRVS